MSKAIRNALNDPVQRAKLMRFIATGGKAPLAIGGRRYVIREVMTLHKP